MSSWYRAHAQLLSRRVKTDWPTDRPTDRPGWRGGRNYDTTIVLCAPTQGNDVKKKASIECLGVWYICHAGGGNGDIFREWWCLL